MNLETGELVAGQYVTPIPITNTVVKAMEAMAEAQGIKSLKITGRSKVRILPADWVAGVHYDDDDSENSSDDDNKDDHDNNNDDEIHEDRFKPITQEEIDDLNAEDDQQLQPKPSDSDNQTAESENENNGEIPTI